MSESVVVVMVLVVVALIEGANGIAFAFRARRTLSSAGLSYHDGPGLLIQEFGVYSIALGLAYGVAVFDPLRRPGILLTGLVINIAAACMHLARSTGIYFGDARPRLSARSERYQGLVHVFATTALCTALLVNP